MALDTSSNAYEQVYQSSGSDESGKYYEGYVEKKETFLKVCFVLVMPRTDSDTDLRRKQLSFCVGIVWYHIRLQG